MGIIIISDDLLEIIQNCSKVAVIKSGKIVNEYDAQSLDESTIINAMM